MDRYEETRHIYDKVAEVYQQKFMELDLYNDTYDAFCALLPEPGSRVFEIGCGPGNITRYLLHQRPDLRVEAIDLSPNMIALAQQNNPSAVCSVMDCREIDRLDRQFDGILCGFCMPYLSYDDCVKLFKDCAALLRNDGIAYFSMIEGRYDDSHYETGSTGDRLFIYNHEEKAIADALKQHGLQPLRRIRKSYPAKAGTATHLIVIARKTSRTRVWESCCG